MYASNYAAAHWHSRQGLDHRIVARRPRRPASRGFIPSRAKPRAAFEGSGWLWPSGTWRSGSGCDSAERTTAYYTAAWLCVSPRIAMLITVCRVDATLQPATPARPGKSPATQISLINIGHLKTNISSIFLQSWGQLVNFRRIYFCFPRRLFSFLIGEKRGFSSKKI